MVTEQLDLVPMHTEAEPTGFVKVLRGYDPKQVDEYLDRVEVALADSDSRHAEDLERISSSEQELEGLRRRVEQAEQRAAGRPEPASLVGERLARMLTLAEQESAAMRSAAREAAEGLLADARKTAAQEYEQRTAALEERERQIAGSAEEADRVRLEAQHDAEVVRDGARRDAEDVTAKAAAANAALTAQAEKAAAEVTQRARQAADDLVGQAAKQAEVQRTHADEDVRQVHDDARAEAVRLTDGAQREVRELARQRDAIAAQMQALKDSLNAAPALTGGSVQLDVRS